MEKFEIPENPEYTEDIRKFKITDPGHADLLNEVVQALVNNEAFLKKMAEQHIRNKENPHGLTPENIGSPSNEYMAEHFVPDYVSQYSGVISSKGWYRIAQKKGSGGFGESCVVIIKRYYNSPSPEYQKVQLVDSYRSNKIIPIVSFTGSDGTHMFTKIRKVNDPQNLISYIEIYQDRDTNPNGILVDILEAKDRYNKKWEVIDPTPTQETVEGINVLASLDLPADFDVSMLLGKSGGAMDGVINFVNNGGIKFNAPNQAETARGIDIADKSGNRIGGIVIHAINGMPDYLYASLGGSRPHNPAAGLAIYADEMKWKNSKVITESSGVAKKAEQSTKDGNGSIIEDTYALKNIYGDDAVSMGRKNGTEIGNKSFAFGYSVVASESFTQAEGIHTTASNYAAHVSGKRNKPMTDGGEYTNQVGDAFVIGNGTNISPSNALRITYQGDVLGTKAFQSSGADYAEFVKPWSDGNLQNEDRIGYFVTVKDGLLYKADAGDYILGITSGNPSVVGNADEDYYWRYERDEFNRIVLEDVPETVQQVDEDGNPVFDEETHEPIMAETGKIIKDARMKLAEDYDSSLQESYVPRAERQEWDYVGMIGVLPVRDDGSCVPGQFCKCGNGGIATFSEKRGFDTFYVIERIAENVVSVILK